MTLGVRRALVALAMIASGCGDGEPPARSDGAGGGTIDPAALGRAQSQCDQGEVAAGLAAVDSVLATAETADGLVTRALCHWVEFHTIGDVDAGEAAEADLTSALAQARVDGAEDALLARIYSHRAALRRALGNENWPSTLSDLNAAIDADTSQSMYVLDRAVARMRRGDSTEAVLDLERYLQLDTVNTARGDLARQLREEMQAQALIPAE